MCHDPSLFCHFGSSFHDPFMDDLFRDHLNFPMWNNELYLDLDFIRVAWTTSPQQSASAPAACVIRRPTDLQAHPIYL